MAYTWTNSIGATELIAAWTDPDFDPEHSAFYYARVLEIPTPRWVLYDKLRLGAEIPEEAVLVGAVGGSGGTAQEDEDASLAGIEGAGFTATP